MTDRPRPPGPVRVVRGNGTEGAVDPRAQAEFGFAHGWLRKRRVDRAITHFRRALAIDPDLEGAHLRLAATLAGERRWVDAIAACEAGLRRFPNQAVLHKLLVASLREHHGHRAALDRHGLVRVDDRPVDIAPGAVLACLVVRNEAARLPWFLEALRRLGVARVLAVDNGSTDGSRELLAADPMVRLWHTTASFNEGNFGSAWFEVLLAEHGVGHWVVMLDADEILAYPGDGDMSVGELCIRLERAGKRALSATMLDMYGPGPVAETRYRPGDDFLDHCPWFDRTSHHVEVPEAGPFANETFRFGGARTRVFGDTVEYLVTKTPLIHYDADVVLAGGQHFTSHPSERIAHHGAAVLHFKYFASFVEYARDEAERGEHADGGRQYASYASTLADDDRLTLHDPAESIRYESCEQLVGLGIVDDGWATEPPPHTPAIPAVAAGPRPRWSAVITVHRRLHTIERALRSVLDQPVVPDQVAVVVDPVDEATTGRIRELVTALPGGDDVELHVLAAPAGHPHVFNEAVAVARGEWVHILHDDDHLLPGYYQALDEALVADPGIGAAFTRHELETDGPVNWRSWLERDDAGPIDGWLERIATECRVQFSAMAVRRAVFEELGGFRSGIGSAFDWEMWQRIAARHRVWFDPRVLCTISRDGTSETDRLVTDGTQILDALAAIESARRYLPVERADHLGRQARERFALHGLDLAAAHLRAGRHDAARHNLAAALRASRSPRVTRAAARLLDTGARPGILPPNA